MKLKSLNLVREAGRFQDFGSIEEEKILEVSILQLCERRAGTSECAKLFRLLTEINIPKFFKHSEVD